MKHRDIIISILIVITLIGIDQLTKVLAFKYLDYGTTYKVLPGIFKMQLVNNSGAAFGILEGKMWFFHIVFLCLLQNTCLHQPFPLPVQVGFQGLPCNAFRGCMLLLY